MTPSAWIPGYRSVVEKRREHGLSGVGITEGVEGITTIKLGKESLKYFKKNPSKRAKIKKQYKNLLNNKRLQFKHNRSQSKQTLNSKGLKSSTRAVSS